ncbi:hypothetical protein BDZ89DRAFT_902485, partial [Hymenopellis radicata]
MLLSHHHLAIEEMRYTRRGQEPVPRQRRLCRFCESAIETPEHALLSCNANAVVVEERGVIMRTLCAEIPDLGDLIRQ